MAAVPFHQHPKRQELLARGPELAKVVLQRACRDGKQWDEADMLDVDAAMDVFRVLAEQQEVGGLRAVIVNDSHLFVFAVAGPWFAPTTRWLIEQFYIRVDRGSAEQALDDIEALGRELGCSKVVMATSLAANDEALGRLLARNGYLPHSSQHFKDL